MARKPSAILTIREFEVMDAVWNLGEATVHSIQEEMGRKSSGKYTSVATMLRYLEQKQLLTHRQEGKTYYYRALKTKESVLLDAALHIVEVFFENDIQKLSEVLKQLEATI